MSIMVCDCCGNALYRWRWWWCCTTVPEDDDYIQNNPCQHNVCFLCFTKSTLKRGATGRYCCQVKDCPQRHRVVSCQYFHRGGIPGEIIENESIMVELGVDQIACILSFLPPKDIMCARCVSKSWREAATITIVPPVDFCVDSMEKYNAMTVMTTVLPNLQQLSICNLGEGCIWSDGEDPDEELGFGSWVANCANCISYDIGIISKFHNLRTLQIDNGALYGSYPSLFQFKNLQNLYLNTTSSDITFDLGVLDGLPSLQRLECMCNDFLTGNINSLSVLRGTLKAVGIKCCKNVEGNFMDLADLPYLEELDLEETAVTGDIRNIGKNDFLSLAFLYLPNGVYGGTGYEFQRISEALGVVEAVYLLKKQRPALVTEDWFAKLSKDSPDWYESVDEDEYESGVEDEYDHLRPPFRIYFVKAGSRIGYRWENGVNYPNKCPCDVNWLDPEPDRESSDYEEFLDALQQIENEDDVYKGYNQPPTQEEYKGVWERIWEEEESESDWSDDSET